MFNLFHYAICSNTQFVLAPDTPEKAKESGQIMEKQRKTEQVRFWVFCMEHIMKRIAGKLRRTILLQFELKTFRFAYWEKPKSSIFIISGFLKPVGTLIYDFEYTK